MSKSLGNQFDPWEALDRQGADALRWWMLTNGSPWESRRIGHEILDEHVRQFLLPLWNVYAFFVTYANASGVDADEVDATPTDPMDRWIRSQLAETVGVVRDRMERVRRDGRRATDPDLPRRSVGVVRAAFTPPLLAPRRRRGRRRRGRLRHAAPVPRHPEPAPGAVHAVRRRGALAQPRCGARRTPRLGAPVRRSPNRTRARSIPRSTPRWRRRARSSSSAGACVPTPRCGRVSRSPRPSRTSRGTTPASRPSCRSSRRSSTCTTCGWRRPPTRSAPGARSPTSRRSVRGSVRGCRRWRRRSPRTTGPLPRPSREAARSRSSSTAGRRGDRPRRRRVGARCPRRMGRGVRRRRHGRAGARAHARAPVARASPASSSASRRMRDAPPASPCSDRIVLHIVATGELADARDAHAAFIAGETLATELRSDPARGRGRVVDGRDRRDARPGLRASGRDRLAVFAPEELLQRGVAGVRITIPARRGGGLRDLDHDGLVAGSLFQGAATSVTTSPPRCSVSSGGSGSRVIGVVASMASVATGSVASCAVGAGCLVFLAIALTDSAWPWTSAGEALQEVALLVEERVDRRGRSAAPSRRRPG